MEYTCTQLTFEGIKDTLTREIWEIKLFIKIFYDFYDIPLVLCYFMLNAHLQPYLINFMILFHSGRLEIIGKRKEKEKIDKT